MELVAVCACARARAAVVAVVGGGRGRGLLGMDAREEGGMRALALRCSL